MFDETSNVPRDVGRLNIIIAHLHLKFGEKT